jgi:hypothetical protein
MEVLERGTEDAAVDLMPRRSRRRWTGEGQRHGDGDNRTDLEGPLVALT